MLVWFSHLLILRDSAKLSTTAIGKQQLIVGRYRKNVQNDFFERFLTSVGTLSCNMLIEKATNFSTKKRKLIEKKKFPIIEFIVAFILSPHRVTGMHIFSACLHQNFAKIMFLLRLKPLDIEFMKHLHDRVNIIPVIAKADTLTPEELAGFKQRVILLKFRYRKRLKGFSVCFCRLVKKLKSIKLESTIFRIRTTKRKNANRKK